MVKKHVIIGFIIGLIANCIGLFVASYFLGTMSENNDSFLEVLKAAQIQGFLGKLLSLGAVLNLIVFFYYLKKKQDYKARGVLLATILIAVITFLIRL
ncbi:MAG: hypothetical protein HKO92_05790 [Flavobacteriaceae bacterium]|nr:hypothetical protein [Bacteroidia bacterium]NNK82613.1 hypothetical protein [Flavobacteriaceae bacterium]